MKCSHTESEYCSGPAVRFAAGPALLAETVLWVIARCEYHCEDEFERGRWAFADLEISEEEAEILAVHLG